MKSDFKKWITFVSFSEYIHCLHWNVDWWRLHILHVELCRAKYLVSETWTAVFLLKLKISQWVLVLGFTWLNSFAWCNFETTGLKKHCLSSLQLVMSFHVCFQILNLTVVKPNCENMPAVLLCGTELVLFTSVMSSSSELWGFQVKARCGVGSENTDWMSCAHWI